MRIILLVIFGAAGTLARYGLDGLIQYRSGASFPAGTLAVNLLGSLLLGMIGQFGLNHLSIPPDWRIGLTVGLMGGFTTFSTFAWDSVHMLSDGQWTRALMYVGGSVGGGIVALMIGIRLGGAL